jgi:hypothetical protein
MAGRGQHDEGRAVQMAIQLPMAPLHSASEAEPSHLAKARIRRCTYRRLIAVTAGEERIYEVECLFPERKVPIPLGDLESAMPVCNACTAAHIFRPDED